MRNSVDSLFVQRFDVSPGDVSETGFVPEVLVSLTTPKHSSKSFKGRHFVGGRFLPPKLAEKVSCFVLSNLETQIFIEMPQSYYPSTYP